MLFRSRLGYSGPLAKGTSNAAPREPQTLPDIDAKVLAPPKKIGAGKRKSR